MNTTTATTTAIIISIIVVTMIITISITNTTITNFIFRVNHTHHRSNQGVCKGCSHSLRSPQIGCRCIREEIAGAKLRRKLQAPAGEETK